MARKPMKLQLKKGALHRALGVPAGKHIPPSALQAAANSKNPLTRKRANFAINAAGWSRHHALRKGR